MAMKNILFLSIAILLIISCKQKPKKLSINVNDLQYKCVHRLSDVIVYDIFTPPVANRIYAYCNLAYYETLWPKYSDKTSIVQKLKGFGQLPIPSSNKKYDFSLAAVKSFFKVAKALTF